MRSSIFYAAPLLAVAYAQTEEDNSVSTTVIEVESGSTTVSSTFVYSNAFTSFLTQTNSLGVVTGMPSVQTAQSALPDAVTTQPTAVTSQPEVATIPAGLPQGVTNIIIGAGTAETSFTVDVQSSTTVVLGAGAEPTDIEIVTASEGFATGSDGITLTASQTADSSSPTDTSSSDNDNTTDSSDSDSNDTSADDADTTDGNDNQTGSATTTDSEDPDSSDSAAISNVQFASAGVFGFGALAAFFL